MCLCRAAEQDPCAPSLQGFQCFTCTSQFPSRSVLLRLFLQAPCKVMVKALGPKVLQERGLQRPKPGSAHEGVGDWKTLLGHSADPGAPSPGWDSGRGGRAHPAGTWLCSRGCQQPHSSRGFSPLPVAQAHAGRTCCAAGMCRGDAAEFPAVTQAVPRSRWGKSSSKRSGPQGGEKGGESTREIPQEARIPSPRQAGRGAPVPYSAAAPPAAGAGTTGAFICLCLPFPPESQGSQPESLRIQLSPGACCVSPRSVSRPVA